ncbi:MAG: PorV/PorQ family protein [Candidatus Marinimicrobia bacterium]|nr:PorV/PorQ family protein [Candidatus Neomarinimicrobiota bacterium]
MSQSRRIIIYSVFMGILLGQSPDIPDVVSKVATSAGNYLKLETGARAIGLGGAFGAVGTGVTGVPYNPASIGFVNRMEVYFSHTEYMVGISHNVLAYGTQLTGSDYIGFHMFWLDSGPMDVTTELYPDGTGEKFNVSSKSFRFVYARSVTDRLKIGMSLNYIRDDIYTVYMQGVAYDIGSNFDTGLFGFKLGMSVTNFGPEVQYHGEGLVQIVSDTTDPDKQLHKVTKKFPLPLTFRLAVANDIIGKESAFVQSDIHRLTLAMDGIKSNDYVMYGSLGLEYGYGEFAFIRCGSHLNHDTMGMAAGGGVRVNMGGSALCVDYAFVNNSTIEPTHQFGLNFEF